MDSVPSPQPIAEPVTSLTREELVAKLAENGQPEFRAGQLLDWVYRKRVRTRLTRCPICLRFCAPCWPSISRFPPSRCPPPRLERHDAEVPFPAARRPTHRDGADPRVSGLVRRGQRPPHALHFHAGWLRLRLQVLRERTERLDAQPPARARSSSKSCARKKSPANGSTTSCSWAWASRWPTTINSCAPSASSTRRGASGSERGTSRFPPAGWPRKFAYLADQPLQIRSGHFAARRDRRGPRADHAGEPQISAGRAARRLPLLPQPQKAEADF